MSARGHARGVVAVRVTTEATDALIELTGTKLQQFWYPGIVQKDLATSGGDRVRATVKELMPKALRPFIVRGLEESHWGDDLVALTGPYLAEQTVCLVTARKAGREALDLLLPLAEKGNADADRRAGRDRRPEGGRRRSASCS